jgi:hypothetical protein
MATIVLGAIGSVVGGPLGGALGALAGQAIDARVLRGKGREGPRLTELKLQTSSYGTPIPKLFGTLRVAGTVIWATDLIERATTEGGGKGRAGSTSYSYSASFAVLLSARPIREVRRIWADGKLLRGAAGDLKVATALRMHLGDEDQAVDPLIASAQGVANAPACRGQAYVVFEGLARADYGNRIPSLTFEVVADEGPVSCGTIVEEMTGGAVAAGDAVTSLGGFAGHGTGRATLDALAAASGAWLVDGGSGLSLRAGHDTAPVEILDAGADGAGRRRRAIAGADSAPRIVTVQHYDPARDYQTGLQRAERPGAGARAEAIELAAALSAGDAKAMAVAALLRSDVARERRTVSGDWRTIGVEPGARVRIAGEDGQWRVIDWSLEAMAVTLELSRIARASPSLPATSGSVNGAADLVAGETVAAIFEMPPLDDTILTTPRLTIAAGGTGAGWRSADLQISSDGGMNWAPVLNRALPATIGTVEAPAGGADATLVDRAGSIDVLLANPAMTLADADAAALDLGANRALVGEEIIQFGRAAPLGEGRWRLTELWRGRRGTEWAAARTTPGDRFVLLDPATLVHVDIPVTMVGGIASLMATGLGDHAPQIVTEQVTGASVAPPSPVHLTAEREDGGWRVRWVRRSRAGWRWGEELDVPLVEEAERYRVVTSSGDESWVQRTEAVLAGSPQWAEVRQIGTHAVSQPSRINLATGD